MGPVLEGICPLAEQGSSVGQSQVEGVSPAALCGSLLNAVKHLYMGLCPGLHR